MNKSNYRNHYKTDLRLERPSDVRRLLNRVTNLVLANEIDKDTARVVATLCNSILTAMDKEILEERVAKIEEYLNIKEAI